jgi:hypothetical protein
LKWRILPLALQKRNVKNFLDPFSRFDISYVC